MYKRIPKEFISDVIDRVNIVDYISQYATLKRVGQKGEQSAKCPLPKHKDDTPSFYVNEHKQTYKCHGCGAGGGIIDFIKEYHGMDFVKAIEEIADFLNLTVPYETNGKKTDFFSYSDIYKQIYNSAQSLAFEHAAEPSRLAHETVVESGIVPVKIKTIKNVVSRALKDKPDYAANILANLPDDEATYFMLPVKTQFSETIECLYLFNEQASTYLPSKPAKSYNKLVYNSHRFSKDTPKKAISVFSAPVSALEFQNRLGTDTAVIASIDSPQSLSKKVFSPFVDDTGFLKSDELIFNLNILAPDLTSQLEHYLRLSVDFAARTSFHFFEGSPKHDMEFDSLNYTDAFSTLCEEKCSAIDMNDESGRASFAKYVEFLLGGNELSSNVTNFLRETAYQIIERPELLKEHLNRHYTKPSSHVKYENLAVPDTSLKDIKNVVNSIISDSMDSSPEEIRDKLKQLKSNLNGSEPELLKICLDKLNFLSYKSSFIKVESFLDDLNEEEKKAYMEPKDSFEDSFKI